MSRIPQPKQIVSARQANTLRSESGRTHIEYNFRRTKSLTPRQKCLNIESEFLQSQSEFDDLDATTEPTCLNEFTKINQDDLLSTCNTALHRFRQKRRTEGGKPMGITRMQPVDQEEYVRHVLHAANFMATGPFERDIESRSWPSTARRQGLAESQPKPLRASSEREVNQFDEPEYVRRVKNISFNEAMATMALDSPPDEQPGEARAQLPSVEFIRKTLNRTSRITNSSENNLSNASLTSSSFDFSAPEDEGDMDPMQCIIS